MCIRDSHKCTVLNRCVFQDSVNDFLALAGDCAGFVFGTPVHWGGATGALTSFLDRAFYADLNGGGGRFYLKPAAVVVSARRAGTTATWDQVNKYFGLMQMPIVTSSYWNMVHGTSPEEVLQDLEGMQVMRVLGHNMASVSYTHLAELARDMGILTIGVVSKPFLFEGRQRMKNAESGIERLKANVDTLVVVPNDRLLSVRCV